MTRKVSLWSAAVLALLSCLWVGEGGFAVFAAAQEPPAASAGGEGAPAPETASAPAPDTVAEPIAAAGGDAAASTETAPAVAAASDPLSGGGAADASGEDVESPSGPRLTEGEETPLDEPKLFADVVELPAPRDWKAVANPVPTDEASVRRGQALYLGKGMCKTCHGVEGDSFSGPRNQFKPVPNGFFEEKWHASRTDGQIMEVLQMGKPGTGMVSFIPDYLTEAEGWDVINFLRSLQGHTSKAYEAYQEYLKKQEEERLRLIKEAGG